MIFTFTSLIDMFLVTVKAKAVIFIKQNIYYKAIVCILLTKKEIKEKIYFCFWLIISESSIMKRLQNLIS